MPMSRRVLQPNDVVGQRIVSVWGTSGSTGPGGWLDTAVGWLLLENGIAVSLPSSDSEEWLSDVVPWSARLLEGSSNGVMSRLAKHLWELLRFPVRKDSVSVVGHRIKAVHRALFKGEPEPGESVIVELDDGRVITFSPVAPHGTGSAGLLVDTELGLDDQDESVTPFWAERAVDNAATPADE